MQNLSAKDFEKKCPYNFETKNQLWCTTISDGHDSFCGCDHPFAHLLSSIFPPGHTDRDLTINQILARDYTELCRSGGKEERNGGGEVAGEDSTKENNGNQEEKDLENIEDIEQLVAALEDAEKR